jgi:SAM-dependent methyltransferase
MAVAECGIEKQREHFESISGEYFSATQHPNSLAFNRLIWAQFLGRHRDVLPRGANVLEPMCGHGIAKEHLEDNLHADFRYTGFDYSRPLVEIARRRMPGAHVFVQDVTTFDSEEKYDLIFLSGGLHHVFDHTVEVLQRLRSALVDGGYLLSAEPTYHNRFYGMVGKAVYRQSPTFEHETEQSYALNQLNEHFLDAGYRIVDQIYPGMAAYVISVSATCFPRLCVGSPTLIKRLMAVEGPIYRHWLGRKMSFCTFTLLQNS